MRHVAFPCLVLVTLVGVVGCGPAGGGTATQSASLGSSATNGSSSGAPSSADGTQQARPAGSFACPSLPEVVSATGISAYTKTVTAGHAVDKNNGQTMDTCAYSDSAQTVTLNITRLSLLPGYTYDDLKSQLQSAGKLRDVSGFGSGAFETQESAPDSDGFDNNCHLVVNSSDTAVVQVVVGSEAAQYPALCSQAEAVARLLAR
jgi:Protein of unknown function (DUF3558)